jgi:hypothetical protein
MTAGLGPVSPGALRPPGGAPPVALRTARAPGGATDRADAISARPPADDLARARLAGTLGGAPPEPAGVGVPLVTSAAAAAAIAAGTHQIRVVDGRTLAYPSQNLGAIESLAPDRPGQTHALERHIGTTLADNVARLTASPLLHAAGSYTSLADAQFATDETIANPANQTAIAAFLADPGRLKTALLRVDLGRDVGASTLQRDVAAGTPTLVPGTTATVVLIKDPTFPEGYRVLTTYPDTRRPEFDARGTPLA